MTLGNWTVILLGIAICFFAIVFKKLFEAIIGFVWGFEFAIVFFLVLLLTGNRAVQNMEESAIIVSAFLFAIIIAALSVIYERILSSIRAFLAVFVLSIFILAVTAQDIDAGAAFVVCIALSIIAALLMWQFYKKAFIIESAITGAILINHVGLMGDSDPSDVLSDILFGYGSPDGIGTAIVLTILVAIAGYAVQSYLLRNMKGREGNSILGSWVNRLNSYGLNSTDASIPNNSISTIIHSPVLEDVLSERECVIFALVNFIIVPLIVHIAYYSSMTYEVHHFLNTICSLLQEIVYAGIIYFGFNKSRKSGLIYCIPPVLGNMYIFWGVYRIASFSSFLYIVCPVIVLFAIRLLSERIYKPYKYLAGLLLYVIIKYFILRWISNGYFYWPIYSNDILPIICATIGFAVLMKRKLNLNIFTLDNIN